MPSKSQALLRGATCLPTDRPSDRRSRQTISAPKQEPAAADENARAGECVGHHQQKRLLVRIDVQKADGLWQHRDAVHDALGSNHLQQNAEQLRSFHRRDPPCLASCRLGGCRALSSADTLGAIVIGPLRPATSRLLPARCVDQCLLAFSSMIIECRSLVTGRRVHRRWTPRRHGRSPNCRVAGRLATRR